jgi:NAD(P)H-hydrate epimerase
MVTLASTPRVLDVVRQRVPEATLLPLPETDAGSVGAAGWDQLSERLSQADAVAVGPGLGRHPSTRELIRRVVRDSPAPLVLDADGLNAFAGDAGAIADRTSDAVLTPHLGDFIRLMGLSSEEAGGGDRVELVRKAAHETGCTVLLKGPQTLIGSLEGHVLVNPTGSPALATAGTGDVLTGALAALLARGVGRAPSEAAICAAYVHGLAGDMAAERTGEGTVASDVAALLPEAIAAIRAGDGNE